MADEPRVSETLAERNVELIARLEEDALHQRSMTEWISDTLVKRIGTLSFVVVHLVAIGVWFAANLGLVPHVRPFDPFPFGILALVVSAEGVFLAIFILVSQNRMSRQADRRAHLDLQISLLSEQEMTTVLEMLQRLCDHFHLSSKSREEVERLMQKTDVHELASELEEKLPTK